MTTWQHGYTYMGAKGARTSFLQFLESELSAALEEGRGGGPHSGPGGGGGSLQNSLEKACLSLPLALHAMALRRVPDSCPCSATAALAIWPVPVPMPMPMPVRNAYAKAHSQQIAGRRGAGVAYPQASARPGRRGGPPGPFGCRHEGWRRSTGCTRPAPREGRRRDTAPRCPRPSGGRCRRCNFAGSSL